MLQYYCHDISLDGTKETVKLNKATNTKTMDSLNLRYSTFKPTKKINVNLKSNSALLPLFRQVSTCTGHIQVPIFCCTNVHPVRYTLLPIYACHLSLRHYSEWAYNRPIGTLTDPHNLIRQVRYSNPHYHMNFSSEFKNSTHLKPFLHSTRA